MDRNTVLLVSVEGLSHCSLVKAAKARLMLDFMSEVGSLEILMQVWRIDCNHKTEGK